MFVELPEVDAETVKMEPFGVIESVKATNDLYSPVSGTIIEVNERLKDDPGLVNRDPYGEGWMVIIEFNNTAELDELISAEAYRLAVSR